MAENEYLSEFHNWCTYPSPSKRRWKFQQNKPPPTKNVTSLRTRWLRTSTKEKFKAEVIRLAKMIEDLFMLHPSWIFATWSMQNLRHTSRRAKEESWSGKDNVKDDNEHKSVLTEQGASASPGGSSKSSGNILQASRFCRRSQRRGSGTHASAHVGSSQIAETAGARVPWSVDTTSTHLGDRKVGMQLNNPWFLVNENCTVKNRENCSWKRRWQEPLLKHDW